MTDILTEETQRFLRATAPASNDLLAEMEAYATEHDHHIVGPTVGQLLRVLTRIAGAERAFEFGSTFGYSAYWIASALPEGGEVVLTDVEPDYLDLAREYLERAGLADRAVYEPVDAHEAIERYDGPIDLVLLDHYNRHYVDALEAVRDKLPPGGIVAADNAMSGNSVHFDDILADFDGEPVETNENTRGTIEYLSVLRDDPDFETTVLPVGDGVAVSVKTD